MSTLAEQVVEQLKIDMDNVYDAGYQKGLKEIGGLDVSKFGIQNEVKGTNVVTLDYVNENEHNVEVKLSSDTITDFSNVKIKVCGANLVDDKAWKIGYTGNIPVGNKLSYTINAIGRWQEIPIPPNSFVNIIFYSKDETKLLRASYYFADENDIVLSGFYDNSKGINSLFRNINSGNACKLSLTIMDVVPEDAHIIVQTIHAYYPHDVPYVDNGTYNVNADGTVEGIKSFAPYMSIVCDTPHVDITAKYYQCANAEWQKFWDEAQAHGTRGNYTFFVCDNFTSKTLNPKYDIQPIIATSMFNLNGTNKYMLLRDIPNVFPSGAKLDFSKATNLTSLFYYNDMVRTTSATALKDVFRGANMVESIEKVIFKADGSQALTRVFDNTNMLQNIVIEGVIGKSVNFQWSSRLTVESAKSIIQHLANYAGTNNAGVYTLTLSSNTWAALDAEGATSPNGNAWRDYVMDLGWNYG